VDNELFQVVKDLNQTELKIMLLIFRNVRGFVEGIDLAGNVIYRETYFVTTGQLANLTGLSKKSVVDNLASLIRRGYIVRVEESKRKMGYRLRYKGEPVGNPNDVTED
jgi:DNA-binding MarR family transcriptional regulator